MNRIETLEHIVSAATPDELPTLAGDLAKALAAVLVRMATPVPPVATIPEAADLLTIEKAATRLGAPKWRLYRHCKNLPFTRKLGHRTPRFDARGLER